MTAYDRMSSYDRLVFELSSPGRVAFSLPAGGVSDPIASDSSIVIVRVAERQDVVPAEFEKGKETLRGELLAGKRNRFFSAYMAKAKQRMKIEINRETLRSVLSA